MKVKMFFFGFNWLPKFLFGLLYYLVEGWQDTETSKKEE